MSNKKFLRNKPTYGGFKYKWEPIDKLPKDIEVRNAKSQKGKEYKNFCNAVPFSQGIDNVVKYVYKYNTPTENIAYVECDYVK